MGADYLLSTVAALLAQALCEQGRLGEAEASLAVTRELAEEDDIESQILWRTARAKVRARQGDGGDEARRLADEALALAADTDDIDVQGDVHADYGAVLVRLGSTDEAAIQFVEARELYARKGNSAFETAMTAALEGAGQARLNARERPTRRRGRRSSTAGRPKDDPPQRWRERRVTRAGGSCRCRRSGR